MNDLTESLTEWAVSATHTVNVNLTVTFTLSGLKWTVRVTESVSNTDKVSDPASEGTYVGVSIQRKFIAINHSPSRTGPVLSLRRKYKQLHTPDSDMTKGLED